MAKVQHGRDLTGEEMGQILEEFANKASRKDLDELAEQIVCRTHRTIQQKVMGLFVACIEKWAVSPSDDRNAATVKLCKKIVDSTGDKYDRVLPYI